MHGIFTYHLDGFYGINIGKDTSCMDPSWDILFLISMWTVYDLRAGGDLNASSIEEGRPRVWKRLKALRSPTGFTQEFEVPKMEVLNLIRWIFP